MVFLKTGLPRTLRVRILKEVSVDGKVAYPGDVWMVPVADALGLIDAEQAERIVDPNVVEVREKLEVYANSVDDGPARMISRLPESERPRRPRVVIPPNLQIGHVLPSR